MSGEKNIITAPLRSTTGIVRSLTFLDHRTADGHPENHGRLEAVYRMLDQTDRLRRLVLVEARPAEEDEILLVHSPLRTVLDQDGLLPSLCPYDLSC